MFSYALPYDPVELVARDAARGVHRRWRMQAMRDLFGRVVVETAWGRIGAPGRTLTRSFAGEADAARYVRALLRRRAGARRRIGVDYVAAR
ncbi:WGR domain-containing protein [uncultured Sphingomonas sp.]|uniref:WGR domain-containing protein n=1 Tax=uncultured Sphingomonas sp. TaxID=158754 RepID=UPI003748E15B